MPLDLVTIPCLSDNYAYLIHDPERGATAVVDVPDPAPIEAALDARGWRLTDILVTHHHNDHIGGVDALRAATGAAVWGNAADAARLPALDRPVTPGKDETFGGQVVEVIDVPGHTIGHVAYHLPEARLLFSADSLMSLGCGRLFEGTAAQMLDTLTRLAALPGETQVCSGHEYTETNARFARGVDPDNAALAARADRVADLRAEGRPTVPVTLAEERATNPFLRADAPELRRFLRMDGADDVEVFAHVRKLRDAF